jgi:hypothetical protein
MTRYGLKQISAMYGLSSTTTWRHMNTLKKKRKFIKISLGRTYTETEVKSLGALLGFDFKPAKK